MYFVRSITHSYFKAFALIAEIRSYRCEFSCEFANPSSNFSCQNCDPPVHSYRFAIFCEFVRLICFHVDQKSNVFQHFPVISVLFERSAFLTFFDLIGQWGCDNPLGMKANGGKRKVKPFPIELVPITDQDRDKFEFALEIDSRKQSSTLHYATD